MDSSVLFIALSVLSFVLALFHVKIGEVDLVVLGLAFLAAGHLPWGLVTRRS